MSPRDTNGRIVCWHRVLPPLDAEPIGHVAVTVRNARMILDGTVEAHY